MAYNNLLKPYRQVATYIDINKVKSLLISPFFIKFALCSLPFCKEDTPFEKQKRNENEDGYNQNKELFYHRNVAENRV